MPLTSEQSERLGSLYETYGRRMVAYAYRKLRGFGRSNDAAWMLAEDIAQSMWVELARRDQDRQFLNQELPEDEVRPVLFVRVKQQISAHFKLHSSSESPVDWTDDVTCNKLCPLMPGGCALAELPAYLAEMVDTLPERERAALLIRVDGTPMRQVGDRLGCGEATARRLVETAVLLLQLDNPQLCGPETSLESLPGWERRALAELSAAKRTALLGMDETARRSLLLLSTGMSLENVTKRLGVTKQPVMNAGRCLSVLRQAGSWDAPHEKKSKAQLIADALRDELATMQPGERLPSKLELMNRFDCGAGTVQGAMNALRSQGLIDSTRGRGFFVTRRVDLAVAA
ncbi:GntR family transcriptional regulator [Streptomyces sp. NBC_00356]|uniref:GntR family transcriptional regulator n=1 Tax=Streptomyces sp. NBC_00356 TaxID=2975724 RepID=UPI002E2743A4